MKLTSPVHLLLILMYVSTISAAVRKRTKFIPFLPHDCVDTLCAKVTNYPAKYLRRVLKDSDLNMYAGNVIKTSEHNDTLGTRWYDASEHENNMCRSNTDSIAPRAAMNIHKKWQFVIQTPFVQTIEYEKCSEDTVCLADRYMPNNYKTGCRQHDVIIKLAMLNEEGLITIDEARVPGGCACVYSKE